MCRVRRTASSRVVPGAQLGLVPLARSLERFADSWSATRSTDHGADARHPHWRVVAESGMSVAGNFLSPNGHCRTQPGTRSTHSGSTSGPARGLGCTAGSPTRDWSTAPAVHSVGKCQSL